MPKNSEIGRLDFYRTRLAEETPLTMGVLIALAQADLSYKPHERSSTARQIISTIIKGLEIRNDLAAKRQAEVAVQGHRCSWQCEAAGEISLFNHFPFS